LCPLAALLALPVPQLAGLPPRASSPRRALCVFLHAPKAVEESFKLLLRGRPLARGDRIRVQDQRPAAERGFDTVDVVRAALWFIQAEDAQVVAHQGRAAAAADISSVPRVAVVPRR